jgi:drug/metabolite transporter (DMT)-like permease
VTRRSWALFAAMCLIWGIPYLMIRVAVRSVEPGTLVFFRTSVGALALLPLAIRGGGFRPLLPRWKPLVAFAIIEMAIPWALLGHAETVLPSSVTGLLICGVPLVVILLSRIIGVGGHPNGIQWFGLLFGLFGVALLVGVDFSSLDGVALLEMVGVIICYAIGPMIMAHSLSDVPRFPVVCAALIVACAVWAPYGLSHLPNDVPAEGILSILGLGLVCTALAFVVFFALIAAIGPGRSTVITYVNTAVAILLGVVLLDEDFTLGMAIGFPVILIGCVLAVRSPRVTADEAAEVDPVPLNQ